MINKKGDCSDRSNCMSPLPMLCESSKLPDGLVCDALDKFTTEIGQLDDNQRGFREGRSTEGLLIYLAETWEKAVDNGEVVSVVLFNFQKAY